MVGVTVRMRANDVRKYQSNEAWTRDDDDDDKDDDDDDDNDDDDDDDNDDDNDDNNDDDKPTCRFNEEISCSCSSLIKR